MTTLFLALLLLQLPPQLDQWEKITETNYEIKNVVQFENKTITTTSMIGLVQVLKPQNSKNEYAFVVSKYPPLTFIPHVNTNNESNSRDEIVVAENYFQKTKLEKLKEMTANADKILIIKWREEIDNRTGERMLDMSIENWLLKPNGEWVFEESKEPIVKIELLSEEFGEERVLVGFKFSLGSNYHILRFDQTILGGVK